MCSGEHHATWLLEHRHRLQPLAVGRREVVGFVAVVEDEVEQLYVAAPCRGQGVADALLIDAERRIRGSGYESAWLAVVAGNVRARRFYERMGWVDDGQIEYLAHGEHGPIAVPAHRYRKARG